MIGGNQYAKEEPTSKVGLVSSEERTIAAYCQFKKGTAQRGATGQHFIAIFRGVRGIQKDAKSGKGESLVEGVEA
jgi:hypothetical protein